MTVRSQPSQRKRKPSVRRGRAKPVLTPGLPGGYAVALLLTQQFRVMTAHEKGILSRATLESLHEYRVALRRSRTLIQGVKDCLPEPILALKGDIKWLSDATSAARDLDVHLKDLDGMIRLAPDEPPEAFEPMRVLLQKRREAEQLKLSALLRSAPYQSTKKRWRQALKSASPAAEDEATIAAVADKAIWKAYRRVLKDGAKITSASPPEALHDLRKKCKKLRYLVEFFTDFKKKNATTAAVKALKELQDCLGAHQDYAIQGAVVHDIRQTLVNQEGTPKRSIAALTHLEAVLSQRQQEARDHFKGLFQRFSSAKTRKRYEKLYHM